MSEHFATSLCKVLFENLRSEASDETGLCQLNNLCFFENPENTIKAMCQFASALSQSCDIELNDNQCRDIIPYILAEAIIRGSEAKTPKIKIASTSLSKTIKNLGLKKLSTYCCDSDNEDIWAFPVVYGRSHMRDLNDPEIVQEIWRAVDGYLATLNKWLSRHGFIMVPSFLAQMETHILELIGNADHAAMNDYDETGGDWAISGYMAKRGEEYVCYVTLITLGRTIYESLRHNENPVTQDYLEKYVVHKDSHIKLSEESLVTAAATHDTVSSRVAGGGNGLTDFLHGFTNAAAAEHKDKRSFVISGAGHVHFCDAYANTVVSVDGRVRQSFNPNDNIYLPPDTRHVYHAENTFPGTIIGVKFHLDEGDLISRFGGNK